MQMNFTFKNFEPSDHLRKYAERRFGKIAKYVPNADTAELKVNLEVDKFRHKADILLVGDNLRISSNEQSEDMYSTVDLLLDKLEGQVRRLRDKGKKNRKKGGQGRGKAPVSAETWDSSDKSGPTIIPSDGFSPKPMMVDEAAMQLENLDQDFLVFLHGETERINVLYRRKDGDFGLIDPGI